MASAGAWTYGARHGQRGVCVYNKHTRFASTADHPLSQYGLRRHPLLLLSLLRPGSISFGTSATCTRTCTRTCTCTPGVVLRAHCSGESEPHHAVVLCHNFILAHSSAVLTLSIQEAPADVVTHNLQHSRQQHATM